MRNVTALQSSYGEANVTIVIVLYYTGIAVAVSIVDTNSISAISKAIERLKWIK